MGFNPHFNLTPLVLNPINYYSKLVITLCQQSTTLNSLHHCYMECYGHLFRHYIRNCWHEVGTKFDDCGTKFVGLSTKYNPEVIKYRP